MDPRDALEQRSRCQSLSSSEPEIDLSSLIQQDQTRSLFTYVMHRQNPEQNEPEPTFNSGHVSRVHFEKLFSANEVVVTAIGKHPLAYVCTAVTYPAVTYGISLIRLHCQSWRYDGTFQKKMEVIDVRWPDGCEQVPMDSLAAYPLKYDTSGLRTRLRKRGEEFWKCRQRRFVSYAYRRSESEVQVANPRYMIDMAMFNEMTSRDKTDDKKADSNIEADDELPEDPFCLLLPPTILGFGLHNKKWAALNIDQIREVDWNRKAFEQRLVLDPRKKELIHALISVHIASSSIATTDVIDGKGKGLISLFHGGPGTGKTLTAESIAELAQKPLYRVTWRDIGTNPEAVERYLESVFCKHR